MSHSLKKVCSIISNILIAALVILTILLVGVRLVGLQVFTVLSGSMEPTYHVGSLIYVKEVDPAQIEPGQPITFMLDENTVATHRVEEVVPDAQDPSVLRFVTKGDANESRDGGLVDSRNVIGSPIFTIPYLGYVANYIQHPPGLYIAIAVGLFMLAIAFFPNFSDDKKEKKDGPASESSEAHSKL